MPENTVNVARPSKWGNPFRLGYDGDRTECVGRFRKHVVPNLPVEELRGKNLACWCGLIDQHGNAMHCHADVLLSLANDIPIEDIQRENIRRAKGEKVR